MTAEPLPPVNLPAASLEPPQPTPGPLVTGARLAELFPGSEYWSWLTLMHAGSIRDTVRRGRIIRAPVRAARDWVDTNGLPIRHNPHVYAAAQQVAHLGKSYAAVAGRKLKLTGPRPPTPAEIGLLDLLVQNPNLAGTAPCDLTLSVAALLVRKGYPSPEPAEMQELSRLLWTYTRARHRDTPAERRLTAVTVAVNYRR